MYKIRKDVVLLAEFRRGRSNNKIQAREAESNIWNFSYGNNNQEKLRYALQQLTDFDNGTRYKDILNNHNLEGYVFKECNAETIVLFDSKKLNLPMHKKLKLSINDDHTPFL